MNDVVYTAKDVFMLSIIMMAITAIITVIFLEDTNSSENLMHRALNNMCVTYGNTSGEALVVIKGDGAYTVVCEKKQSFGESTWNVSRLI